MRTMGDVCCLDKQVQENGLDGYDKMVKESDSTSRYLHKKFKKVATLEDTSPKKEKGVLFSIPQEEVEETNPTSDGRYVCPYCKLSWSKPSVLQKHIRAHTNERPYPCLPCGFAFKTKSNLYKHRRSRAHTLKADGQSSEEEDGGSPSETSNKPYKPKFHMAETSVSSSASTCSSPFSSSPSPDLLNAHISKLITENQAMIFDSDWTSVKRDHRTPSPPRKGDALRLLPYTVVPMMPEPEDLSSTATFEPLNLTVKEPRKRGICETTCSSEASPAKEPFAKDYPTRIKEIPDLSRITEEILYPCPHCKVVFRTSDYLNTHLFSCKPKSSPGPLLGKTPLVDTSMKDHFKKRKLDINRIECAKQNSMKLFGGEVQVLDVAAENRSLQVELSKESAKKDAHVLTFTKTGLSAVGGTMVQSDSTNGKPAYTEKLVLPIIPSVATPTIKVPGISTPVQVPQLRFPPALNPLTSITAFNPLTLPAANMTPLKGSPTPFGGGVGTILHGGKAIPFVPGMPGPNSLLSSPPPLVPVEKSVIIRSPGPPLAKAETLKRPPPTVVVRPLPPVEPHPTSAPAAKPPEETKDALASSNDWKERKFLRPSSLPLKPGTYTPKKQLTTPLHSTSLISPETPRPRKSYGQLYLNGHAYTYLGLKCSTRMSFCTLNKPQPIYVPLAPDQYKVSMYSNWAICSDASPTPPGVDTRRAMSCYDTRNRNSSYTTANRNKQDLVSHSTYKSAPPVELQKPSSSSPASDPKPDENELPLEKAQICEGGFESNEEYTYIRGRGRGRYVCKECGIRCKKPSMLKKHIRTHTDLRPYTCKYCAFSFKTKGNLTKHMKSKAHYKKCIELDISPVPTSIDDGCVDILNANDPGWSQKDDLCVNEDTSEESEEEDSEDEEESEDEGYEGEPGYSCRMEREAAKSLLFLSEVTLETAHRQYVSAGLVAQSSKPRTYPYTLSPNKVEPASIELTSKADMWRSDVLSLNKDCQDLNITARLSPRSETTESTRPIDLSNKSIALTGGTCKTPVISSVGGQAHLLASICSTTEKLASTPTSQYPEDSTLLHAYLTERAVRDQQIKLQHHPRKRLQDLSNERVTESEPKTIVPSPTIPLKAETKLDEPDVEERVLAPRCDTPLATTMKKADSPPSLLSPSSPTNKKQAEFREPASALSYISSTEDGKSMCSFCNKIFNKPSQLRLHVNIHYFERPFRCEACAVSFRTKGHLQKHLRSLSHLNKVNMNSTFGTATTSNPRPFKCDDCKIAFRIHGHLAKHFRSKMHIMKLECLGKLPFGTYAELERSGINMNDIDTTDCENSLESLQVLAQKLSIEKDPSKPDHWGEGSELLGGSASEDEVMSDRSESRPDVDPINDLR